MEHTTGSPLPALDIPAMSSTAARPTAQKPVGGGLTPNGDGSAHVQLGGLIEFARSTRV